MGIRTNTGIYGRVGNLVTYKMKGKDVVRELPGEIRQSKATKASAGDFGKIKKLSRYLRHELRYVLSTYKSMPVMFMMDSAVRRWYYEYYRKPEVLEMDPGFFGNLELKPGVSASVKELLGVEPVVVLGEKKVELQFPAMTKENLRYFDGITTVSFCLKVSGALINQKGEVTSYERGSSYSIDKPVGEDGIGPFSIILDKFEKPLEGLFVAYLSLRFQIKNQWRDEEDKKPVVVVGSWFNGVKPEITLNKDEEEDPG